MRIEDIVLFFSANIHSSRTSVIQSSVSNVNPLVEDLVDPGKLWSSESSRQSISVPLSKRLFVAYKRFGSKWPSKARF